MEITNIILMYNLLIKKYMKQWFISVAKQIIVAVATFAIMSVVVVGALSMYKLSEYQDRLLKSERYINVLETTIDSWNISIDNTFGKCDEYLDYYNK